MILSEGHGTAGKNISEMLDVDQFSLRVYIARESLQKDRVMEFKLILVLLYLLTASGAMWMTLTERRTMGITSFFHGILAMLACALWPLALLTMLALANRKEQADLGRHSQA